MAIQGTVEKAKLAGEGVKSEYNLTAEQIQWLTLNVNESKVELAKRLGVNRGTLYNLIRKYGITAKQKQKESKKQRAIRRTVAQIEAKAEHMEQREREKLINDAAKQIAKGRTLEDFIQDTVKGKDGQPIVYNGQVLTTKEALDIALINQAKESPQGNLALRAQALAAEVKQEEKEMKEKSKQMIKQLTPKLAARKKRMREALESYGLWSGMMETTLDNWGNAFMQLEVARMQWREAGMPSVEKHVTAQAQVQLVPSQYKEAVNRAQKLFNECDQKLSTALSKYQRITGRSEEDNSFLSEMMEGLKKIE